MTEKAARAAPDWERIRAAGVPHPSDTAAIAELLAAAKQGAEEMQELMQVMRGLVKEACELRIQNIGRPVVNHAAYAELQALRAPWAPLAAMHRLNGEARGVAVLDTMLRVGFGPVADAIGDQVLRVHPEFQCGRRGRVDRAVEHEGNRLSLIEVKDGSSPRDIVAGIGQVLFYKAAAERSTAFGQIDPMLAVLHDFDPDIARACSLAGVTYIPMGDIAWTRSLSKLVDFVICGGLPK